MTNKQRAKELARRILRYLVKTWTSATLDQQEAHVQNLIERALLAQQAEHEADCATAVAEALKFETALRDLLSCGVLADPKWYGASKEVTRAREVLALKPRSDMVCVPREKLFSWGTAMPVLEAMLRKVLCFGAADKAKEMQKEIGALLAAAEADKEGRVKP